MKIVITCKLPEELLKSIKEKFEVVMSEVENGPMPREQLLQEITDAEGLFTNVADKIDKELFEKAKQLKVISTMAVGYDNIDLEEARKRNILVGHTPGVLTEATADLTFALLMATGRRVVEAANVIKEDAWKSWGPFFLTGQEVYGKTIGIIGMGRIGLGVAKRAKGFSMEILYHNRSRNEEAENEVGAIYKEFEELLQQSDYVVLLAPSTPETYHMFSTEQFKMMKSTAVFINTSRGSNVDEKALYEALKAKEIWAAGLDVFEVEPISSEHPLLQLENVTALPHIGSAAIETRVAMARLAFKNLVNGLEGRALVHQVK
ncbi:2-hydroxyacid dehydrogenase [Halalkalibacter akibai]|uniref:Glyoxylate reductase n=1 Tax=Halalkalibacter akibai (strain ATCC 43226 / DSM 21942 / CIP 109018 / JCM 9157 / 1139) TaxID=1236973 RepID=W4QWF1_HALA3|nr:D-glycerate dehydrogenase [Halalkalibacter akibai]GAE36406.1 glyoxylate reductase [Halalkalibacter akibai JCM 9157]